MFCCADDTDCILNTTFNETQQNATIDNDVLIIAWPYRLEGLTKMDSPIYNVIVMCNQQVFPPEEIIDRIACRQPYQ